MSTNDFDRKVPAVGHGDNIQLAHAVRGDPVSGTQGQNGSGLREGIQQAGLFSTAPYVPPEEQAKAKLARARENKCRANDDTCNGWAHKDGSGLCLGHKRALALGRDIGV